MRVLVTGSAGFVGRHMTRHLSDGGHLVTGIDLVNGHDVRDMFRSDIACYDLVIHCAAIVGGRAMIDGEPLKLAVDLAIDADLFGWALRTRPGKIVYFSSSAAYPTWLQDRNSTIRLREDHLDLDMLHTPDAVYGWAKLTGELLAQHARREGLDVLVVRPFSGYGADQTLDYPFPSFIDRAARRADPFDIWGDGEQVRDWIHIDDICAAVLTAVEQNVPGPVNLGTGIGTTFNTLARMVCEQAGYSPTFRRLPAAPTGVHHRVADVSRMLGFYTPQVTLADGIARALDTAKAAA